MLYPRTRVLVLRDSHFDSWEPLAPKILLEGLSPKLEKDLEDTELDVLTDVLAKFNPTPTDMRTTLAS